MYKSTDSPAPHINQKLSYCNWQYLICSISAYEKGLNPDICIWYRPHFWWMQPLGSFYKGSASHLQFHHPLPTAPLSCRDPQPWAACSRAAPEHTLLLLQDPSAPWGWGKHRDVGLQPPGSPVQVHLHRTMSVPCYLCCTPTNTPQPAAQALPSWRNATLNPARTIFELDQNLAANQAGSFFHKVREVCFHQPLFFAYNNDWEAKVQAGQVKYPPSSGTGISKPAQMRKSKTWVLLCWCNLWQ